jgi:hypothetical protein
MEDAKAVQTVLPGLAGKPYTSPAIIHSERAEARAVLCNKGPHDCIPGPANS